MRKYYYANGKIIALRMDKEWIRVYVISRRF